MCGCSADARSQLTGCHGTSVERRIVADDGTVGDGGLRSHHKQAATPSRTSIALRYKVHMGMGMPDAGFGLSTRTEMSERETSSLLLPSILIHYHPH